MLRKRILRDGREDAGAELWLAAAVLAAALALRQRFLRGRLCFLRRRMARLAHNMRSPLGQVCLFGVGMPCCEELLHSAGRDDCPTADVQVRLLPLWRWLGLWLRPWRGGRGAAGLLLLLPVLPLLCRRLLLPGVPLAVPVVRRCRLPLQLLLLLLRRGCCCGLGCCR